MPVRLLTVLLVVALAAASADLAHAQETPAPLRLGTDGHGVRLVQRGTPAHLVVLLSPKRYRAVAGKELQMVCAPVPDVTLGGDLAGGPRHDFGDAPRPRGSVGAVLHPPRRHTPFVTRLSPQWDWCAFVVRTVRDRGRVTHEVGFATVPLTPAGAAFADERRAALSVIVSDLLLFTRPERVKQVARWLHAVVLSSPTEAPPPGRLGLYSDHRRHVYAAQIDRAGDLLFLDHDGDVVQTNLLRYMQDEALLWGM